MNRLFLFLLSLVVALPCFAQNQTEEVNPACLERNFNDLGVAIVRNDDVSVIRELIKKIPDINACPEADLLKEAIDWKSDEPTATRWVRYDSNDIFSDWPDSSYQVSDNSPRIFSQKEQNNIDIIRSLINAGMIPKDRAIGDAINKKKSVIVPDLIRAGAPMAGWELRGAIILNDADKETIKALLDAGVEIDYNDHGHDTALLYAISEARADIVDILLNAGADPNFGTEDAYDYSNQTPLMSAVSRDTEKPMFPIVSRLIAAGADINAYNEKDHLYVIGYAKRPKMVKYLLGKGAKGALISAGFWKIATLKDVKEQIEKGEDVNARGYNNKTPLNYAYMYSPQKEQMIAFLTKNGAKGPHLPWDSKMELNPENVKKQLRDEANPNMGENLLKAVKNNDTETTQLLLEGGADPNIYTPAEVRDSGYTRLIFCDSPLCQAIDNNNMDIINLLLKHGTDLKREKHILIYKDLPSETTKLLIEHGADVNAIAGSLSPLQKALDKKDMDLFEYLLKHGADINAKVNDKSLLMNLVSRNAKENIPLIEKLIDFGADVNLTDTEGHNVLSYVDDYRDDTSDVIEFLVKKGADINHRDNLGRTPLMNIVKRHHHDNQKNIKKLVELGADVNATDKNGITVLDLAIMNGKHDVLEFLVQRGAKESPLGYVWITPRNTSQSRIMEKWQNMTLDELKEIIANPLDKDYFFDRPKPQTTADGKIIAHISGGECAYGSDGLTSRKWCVPHEYAKKEGFLPILPLSKTGYTPYQVPDDIKTTPKDIYSTLLLNAARYNAKPEIIKYLIDSGADVNARDQDKMTPIMWASLDNANPKTLEILVQAGADINARAKNGKTAIYFAIAGKNTVDIIKKMVELGADVNVKDEEDIMPLDISNQINNVHIDSAIYPSEVTKYLVKIGARATGPYVMCWCELSREKGTETCSSYIV